MWWRTSDCSPLLIYQPREDERLSWPGWLTYSGRRTHISGHSSATVSVLKICRYSNYRRRIIVFVCVINRAQKYLKVSTSDDRGKFNESVGFRKVFYNSEHSRLLPRF